MGRNIAAIGRYGVFTVSGMSREARNGRPNTMGTLSSWSRGVSFHADSGLTFTYRIIDAVTYHQRIVRRGQPGMQGPYTVTLTTSAANEGLATRVPSSSFPIVIKGRVFVRMSLQQADMATAVRIAPSAILRTAVMEGGDMAAGYAISTGVIAAGEHLLQVSLGEPEIALKSFMAN